MKNGQTRQEMGRNPVKRKFTRFLYYSGSLLYSRMNSLEFWYMFFSSDVHTTYGGYSSERRVIMLLGNYVPFLPLWNTEGIIDFNSGAN